MTHLLPSDSLAQWASLTGTSATEVARIRRQIDRLPKGVSITPRGLFWRVQLRRKGTQTATFSADTFDEAVNKAQTHQARLVVGDTPQLDIERQTFRDLAGRYRVDILPQKPISASTRAGELQKLDYVCRATWSNLFAVDVTPSVLLAWRRELEKQGLAPDSVRLYLAQVSIVYNSARLIYDTARLVNPVVRGVKPTGRRLDRALTAAEADRLAAAAAALGPRELVCVLIGLDAGLRAGEVEALKWRDFHRAADPVPTLFVAAGETAKDDDRWVPVSPRLFQALDALAAAIPGERGERLVGWSSDRIRRAFYTARDAAGLGKDVHFHTLRHTCITSLSARYGHMPDRQLMRITGHKTTAMLRRYDHNRGKQHLEEFRREWAA